MVASETFDFLVMSEMAASWRPLSAKMLSAAFKMAVRLTGFVGALRFIDELPVLEAIRFDSGQIY